MADVRYRVCLQQHIAIQAEEEFNRFAKRLIATTRPSESVTNEMLVEQEHDEFEIFLDMMAQNQHSSQAFASDEVEAALAHFKIMERVKGPNIFDIIDKFYPEVLRYPCKILASLPVTQVSCERVFSQLKYIKNDHRARMKPDILHSIG